MKRRFSTGGVPTTGGGYETPMPQYPFPSAKGASEAPSTNTNVTVNGQTVDAGKSSNPFKNPNAESVGAEEAQPMRRGGKVKAKKVRGDGIVQRGKTRGRFV